MARQLTCTFRGQIIDPNITWVCGWGDCPRHWLESNASFAMPVLYREQYLFPFFEFPSALSEGRIAFHVKPLMNTDTRLGGLYSDGTCKISIYRSTDGYSNFFPFFFIGGSYLYPPVELRNPFDDAAIIEVYWKCDGANGIAKLYHNGICILTVSPVNIGTTLNRFMLGSPTTTYPGLCHTEWVALEDADVECSALRFARLAPNAAGSSTQLSPVPSGNNYDLVDAPLTGAAGAPVALSQYCLADAANEQDSYNVAAAPSDIDTINAVRVLGVAAQQGNGFLAKSLLRTGGTDYVGDSCDVQHSYGLFQHRWTQNPKVNEAWSIIDLDSLEIGVKAVSS